MMTITYLGDEPTVWRGVAFEPHLPVSVGDAMMISKAADNPFFEVSPDVAVSDDDGIENLRAMALELDVKVDRRWGAARIQQAIDEALEG